MTDNAASVTKSGLAGRSEAERQGTGTGIMTSLGGSGMVEQPYVDNMAIKTHDFNLNP